ncbi:ribosome maturation factor RimP [Streptococcus gallolyticus]|jgi:ribosome maturation factor RimP|uniref:ribosome maturation factor RimP n=1 Tax=Streptococcus gallolyticus TaxID=315405 RepID=UPI0022B5EE1C|nr:ribosome maturation factor RimP [Streptococcus gallolyticus]WAW99384.1 ribosome maturation factor RimP [Streptococcus gallolyticus]
MSVVNFLFLILKIKEGILIANANTIIDVVTEVVAPAIKEPFELVDVEYEKMGSDYVLSILIDKPEGITVDDTAELTEIISPLLDTIKPDPFPEQYMLEVSSPGLERPLKTKEALEKAVGSYVNVSLYKAIDKVKVFQGDLVAFDGDTLIIDYLDKTRKKTVEIPYSTVAKARLAVKL